MVLTRSRAASPTRAGAPSTIDAAPTSVTDALDGPPPRDGRAGAAPTDLASPALDDLAPAPPRCYLDANTSTAAPTGAPSTAAASTVVMTTEQLLLLIERLSAPGPVSSTNSHFTPNFAKCTARFDGEKSSDVVAFTDAVLTYKECARVEDEMALKGLSMLLTGMAATWWQGVKATTATWTEAVESLKNTFGPRLPPHQIYRKLFEREQRQQEPTDLFICNLRALISQLPPSSLTEVVQLDMIYGLLHLRIREKMHRTMFKTFDEMITCARRVEDILNENHPQTSTSSSVAENAGSKKRPQCGYCKQYGHYKDACQRLKDKKTTKDSSTDGDKRPPITCFGCGAPGVIRSNCATCKAKNTVPSASLQAEPASFQSVSATSASELDSRVRPVVSVVIYGVEGKLLVDTGARHSIGSVSLRNHLVKNGQKFKNVFTELKYADGRICAQHVEVAHVNVKVRGTVLAVSFIMLPHATESLLGMNFVQAAGMVLDFDMGVWYMRHDRTPQPIGFEPATGQPIGCSSVNLQPEEGSHLRPDERGKLSCLLNAHEDIFKPGGGPTQFAVHHIDTGDAAPIAVPPYRVSPAKKEIIRKELDIRKAEGDRHRRDILPYKKGDLVLVETHFQSNAAKGFSSKFAPRREGPYRVSKVITPTSFEIVDSIGEVRGKYHASALTPYVGDSTAVCHPRRRGRPAKPRSGRPGDLEGEVIASGTVPRTPSPARECRRSQRIQNRA